MTLSEYLAWWRQRPADDCGSNSSAGTPKSLWAHVAAAAEADSSSSGCGHSDGLSISGVTGGSSRGGQQAAPLLYLKDWHFASEHPQYQVASLYYSSRSYETCVVHGP
jgi:hypothetical protein